MLHYHGTPITPMSALTAIAGRHFCVSFTRPDNVRHCHEIGQSVMLDNGAFSLWRRGQPTDWPAYYRWCDRWLDYPTTWAVIPDQIDAPQCVQDSLIHDWPHRHRGVPVWHMNEDIQRLLRLADTWPRVCIGSTSLYSRVLSSPWQRRMDETWTQLMKRHKRPPWIHMLRGMACSGKRWPFASVDSTDVGRNHNRVQNTSLSLANRWDAVQCPGVWAEAEVACTA
jgi:hypothetical protein